MKKKFRSFEDARKFVHSLGLKNNQEWRKYCSSGIKPENIPSNPNSTYTVWKNKGWKGMGDWVGTGRMASQEISKNYLLWPEAKKEYRRLHKEYGLMNRKDWIRFAKTRRKLLEKLHLPESPWLVYTKEKVWKRMKK